VQEGRALQQRRKEPARISGRSLVYLCFCHVSAFVLAVALFVDGTILLKKGLKIIRKSPSTTPLAQTADLYVRGRPPSLL
jgi:hypothetical protein